MKMYNRYNVELEKLKENNCLRFLRDTHSEGKCILFDGKKYINFSSNDYLGISSDTNLWNEFLEELPEEYLGGACSSRLLTGNSTYYTQLENFLADLYKREAVMVFNSGYHANVGILPTLVTEKDIIISDKLVHASIIDGIRLSPAKSIRFRHNDLQHLEEILEKEKNNHESVFIVTESVFSMDGDLAEIEKLIELKKKYSAFLYLDEAHAIGVLGDRGLGLSEEKNMISEVDFIVGTLGKAIASQGAFVVCNKLIKEYLVNKMRSVIFTTALPPISLLWTKKALQKALFMQQEREYLRKLGQYFREKLQETGMKTGGKSQIVPVIIGENAGCVKVANKLRDQGYFLLPVRPPTVPHGTARLRFSLTVQMNMQEIDNIMEVLKSK